MILCYTNYVVHVRHMAIIKALDSQYVCTKPLL